MIVAVIAVGAVAIFLTVRLIVFLIETDAVPERKTVMRREQIDRGAGRAAIAFKHIAGSGETTGKLPVVRLRGNQNRRAASRKWSFHSANGGGKFPT